MDLPNSKLYSAEEKNNESENKAMETIQTDVTGGKKA